MGYLHPLRDIAFCSASRNARAAKCSPITCLSSQTGAAQTKLIRKRFSNILRCREVDAKITGGGLAFGLDLAARVVIGIILPRKNSHIGGKCIKIARWEKSPAFWK